MVVSNLQQYFRTMWKETEGIVHLAAKGKEPNDWHATLFTWPKDERRIIEYAQRRAPQHEVFVNPVIYKDTGVRDKTVLNRDNVLGTWVLWADFDGNARIKWPTNSDVPEPSIRIVTSSETHQHCYWELTDFLTDPDSIEAKNRTIAYKLDADKSGWDYSQLLRPPDTTNHGYGKDRKGRTFDVRFEEVSGRNYPSSALVENDDYRPIVSFFPGVEKIPTITKVLSAYTFPKSFQELLNYDRFPQDRSGALVRLAYLSAEVGLTDPEMYSVINYADSVWGKYAGRRDHDRRLVDIIDKVRRTVPFGLPAVQFSNLFGDIEVAPKSGYSYQEFMDLKIQFDWLFEGLVPVNGYLIVYGAPGVGKTLLSMDLADCLIFNQSWLIWKCNKPGAKVLFLSLEMNQAMLQEQYRVMSQKYSEDQCKQLDKQLKIYPLAETLPLDKPEGRKYLTQILSESDFHPDLILIDSLSELSEKSLQDDEPARNINRFLRHIRNRYNTAICLVHHNKKSGQHGNHSDLDDMWGSRFLGAGADSVLYFEDTYPPTDEVLCTHDKSRMSRKTDPFYITREWFNFTFTFGGNSNNQTSTEKDAKGIADVLRDAAVGKGSSRTS